MNTVDAKAIRILDTIIAVVVVVVVSIHLFRLTWSVITLRSLLFEIGYLGYGLALIGSITGIILARNFTANASRIIVLAHLLMVGVMAFPFASAVDLIRMSSQADSWGKAFLLATSVMLYLPLLVIAVLSVAVILVAVRMAAKRFTSSNE